MADEAIVDRSVHAAPKDYTVGGGIALALKAVRAVVDGTGAQGSFVPALQLIAPAGDVMWTAIPSQTVPAGGQADVSWFPDVIGAGAEAAGSDATGTISKLTSSAGTIAVGAPSGPTTNVDLPTTGVAAGTYGDASHVGAVTVDAEGRVTAASNVGIAGGSGTIGFEIGYDQITANVNVTSANEAAGTTIISCGAHTFDGAAVLVEFFFNIENGTNTPIVVSLFEGATQITRLCEFIPPSTGNFGLMMSGWYRFTPSAASHTYTVSAFKNGGAGNNGTVVAGNGGTGGEPPAFIRFTKV